ncbi:MAG: hypothetical protein IJI41_08030 [Anaerolineaceae bacterium]|nr:hypothetical protein [Anaerolineaceae bacterium]
MKAFKEFSREDKSFWFFVRFVSEKLHYTEKGSDSVKSYPKESVENLCDSEGIDATPDQIAQLVLYSQMRANLLNNVVKNNLMDLDEAKREFNNLYNERHYKSKLIINKQSGDKKAINYFTAIITMIAEKILGGEEDFDPDPHGLIYILKNKKIIGASSRRFDGAYPSIYSPKIVWEVKEYYYTKSFGSRVADAVYETQLDGYELNEILNRTGESVHHVMLIDSYYTFWVKGKSYLCRFIDALNMGLIDDLIIGKEVLTEWEKILKQYK